MRATTLNTSMKLLVVIAVITLLAGVAAAAVGGAIYTTTSTGTTVNGNIYANKADVYLNGGPQNAHDPGLVPDGTYYFQVTDPSGAVLLSLDDISCRAVVVTGGRITGVPTTPPPVACVDGYHNLGTFDSANGEQPIQLCNPNTSKCPTDFADTPNPGGEYKAWLTPVANYSPAGQDNCSQPSSHQSYGFCDSDSKTDNFKIKSPNAAYIVVCKFNDLDGNGIQDNSEPLIPFWPIDAANVDTLTGPLGIVKTATDATGCVSFSVSTFPNSDNTDTVTLNEEVPAGWQETAPPSGTYDTNGILTGSAGPTSVAGFVETITVKAGDTITAPNFGNTCVNFDPTNGCGGNDIVLSVKKDANPSLTRTYTWGITKSVDNTTVYSAGGGASNPAKYTVSVTHDNGTDSGWLVTGTIKVSNPSLVDVTNVNVTDAVDNGGTCVITFGPNGDGTGLTIPASSEVPVPYTCTYSSLPADGTNTATALSPSGSQIGTASIAFSGAAIKIVDGSVTVTDTLGGTLGTVSYTDPSPTSFMYSETFNDKAGTCTSHQNTATFTTNTTGATGTAGVTVTDCQGADLTVSKTAAAAFNSSIAKSVNQTKVEQAGGNVTFNYTVTVSESAWAVSGNITVTNPNDWESVTATVGDALSDAGGVCIVNGGTTSVTVVASSYVSVPYNCTFAARPTAVSGTNTGSATWNAATAHTPDSSATSLAVGYTFSTLTITDNVQSSAYPQPTGCNAILGTVSVTTTTPSTTPGCGVLSLKSPSWGIFTYSITDANSSAGTCSSYNNTAMITGGTSSNQVTVTVCNTGTGALTMGFWKNTNGAKIIDAGLSTGGVCNSGTWLRLLEPFQDLSATATCKQVASYVSTTIGAATCGGSTCNPMLKAQMLATALDVYFSDPTLGGNKIGAYNGLGSKTPALGSIAIDLSKVCSMVDGSSSSSCSSSNEDARYEFGIATSCTGATVNTMLNYANYLSSMNGSPNGSSVSNSGGSKWYNQVKNPKQVYAKDGFDTVNNQVANIASSGVCTSTF